MTKWIKGKVQSTNAEPYSPKINQFLASSSDSLPS